MVIEENVEARANALERLSQCRNAQDVDAEFPNLAHLVRLLLDRPGLSTRASRTVVKAVAEVLTGTSVHGEVEASTFLQGVEALAYASLVSPLLSSDRLARLVVHAAATPLAYQPLLNADLYDQIFTLVSPYDEDRRERLLTSLWDTSHDLKWWDTLDGTLQDPQGNTDHNLQDGLELFVEDGHLRLFPEAQERSWWSYYDDRGEQLCAVANSLGPHIISELYAICETLPVSKHDIMPNYDDDFRWESTPLLTLLQASKGMKVSKRFWRMLGSEPGRYQNSVHVLAANVLPVLPYLPKEAQDILLGSPAFVKTLPLALNNFHSSEDATRVRSFLNENLSFPSADAPLKESFELFQVGLCSSVQADRLRSEYKDLNGSQRYQLLSGSLPIIDELAAMEEDQSIIAAALQNHRRPIAAVAALAPHARSWGARNALVLAVVGHNELPENVDASLLREVAVESEDPFTCMRTADLLSQAGHRVPVEVWEVVKGNAYLASSSYRSLLRQGVDIHKDYLTGANAQENRVTLAHRVIGSPARQPKNPMVKIVAKVAKRAASIETPERPREWRDLAPVLVNTPYPLPESVKELSGWEVRSLSGATIQLLSTPQELHDNASMMRNCSFDYNDKCLKGAYAIFAVEGEDTWYNFSFRKGKKKWRFDQIESRFNQGDVPDDLAEEAAKLTKRLN